MEKAASGPGISPALSQQQDGEDFDDNLSQYTEHTNVKIQTGGQEEQYRVKKSTVARAHRQLDAKLVSSGIVTPQVLERY